MAGLIKELDIVIGSAKLQADHPELFHYTRPEGFRAIIERTGCRANGRNTRPTASASFWTPSRCAGCWV
jgi:hypothetical protein